VGDQELWSQAGTDLPEIIWDTSDPRQDESPPAEDANSEALPQPSETAENSENTEALSTTPESSESENTAETHSHPVASGSPASAAPGEGPGEGRRRSARLLYQEWPRAEILTQIENEGKFRFSLKVEADGHVSDWEILESFDCDVCATEAERIVLSLRFRPALEDGRPVACWLPFEIRFFGSD
jgi:outer membrane biosynthesis protein TonB